MADEVFLAVDLGASGGRVLAGLFSGQRLTLEEVHRFENGALPLSGSLHWDVLQLWHHVVTGLRHAAARYGNRIRSIGVDAWGVDFALLGRGDVLLGNPHSYRDARSAGMLERVVEKVGRKQVFDETGVQFMSINTLYQVMALRASNSPLLEMAESFLMIPDFFNWLLTGEKANEFTNATTTQMYNTAQRRWSTELLEALDIPTRMFRPPVEPGTKLGALRSAIAADTGLSRVEVIVPGTHDTASAVMAVPAASSQPSANPDWCYLSSGTWSLLGVEVPQPVINDECLALNFTNEGGVGGTIRLLKNITGLWLVQECRRAWSRSGKSWSWDELNRHAAQAPALKAHINPDHADFMAPDNMPEAIRTACRNSGQTVPESDGAIIRTALESLALKYRQVLGWTESLVHTRLNTIHVVGGGAQNRQLCQMTADACGRTVVSGPIEATALGNVLMQAVAAGSLSSIAEARDVVRESFPVETFEPKSTSAWDAAYERFVGLS